MLQGVPGGIIRRQPQYQPQRRPDPNDQEEETRRRRPIGSPPCPLGRTPSGIPPGRCSPPRSSGGTRSPRFGGDGGYGSRPSPQDQGHRSSQDDVAAAIAASLQDQARRRSQDAGAADTDAAIAASLRDQSRFAQERGAADVAAAMSASRQTQQATEDEELGRALARSMIDDANRPPPRSRPQDPNEAATELLVGQLTVESRSQVDEQAANEELIRRMIEDDAQGLN
jgi:hypothetical protein